MPLTNTVLQYALAGFTALLAAWGYADRTRRVAFWLGAIYKDIVVYGLFVALLWLRPQGLMGKA